MTTVLIQSRNGHPYSMNGMAAFLGFSELGFEVRLFEPHQLNESMLPSDSIVVGGIGTLQKALKLLNLPIPEPVDYPEELLEFTGRRIELTTLGEVFQCGDFPFFIKPMDKQFLFKGTVVQSQADLVSLAPIEEESRVYKSEVVSFASEYRCYVLNGKILACKHYYGNSLLFPDPDLIRRAVAQYAKAPIACAVDFGVTEEGRTLLVEVNDAYSLGSYGLMPIAYARFLEARWREIRGEEYREQYGVFFS